MLKEHEGIKLSRETVRRLRRQAGMPAKRRRRPKNTEDAGERAAQEGLMMLWDGSPHRWFGEENPPCS